MLLKRETPLLWGASSSSRSDRLEASKKMIGKVNAVEALIILICFWTNHQGLYRLRKQSTKAQSRQNRIKWEGRSSSETGVVWTSNVSTKTWSKVRLSKLYLRQISEVSRLLKPETNTSRSQSSVTSLDSKPMPYHWRSSIFRMVKLTAIRQAREAHPRSLEAQSYLNWGTN